MATVVLLVIGVRLTSEPPVVAAYRFDPHSSTAVLVRYDDDGHEISRKLLHGVLIERVDGKRRPFCGGSVAGHNAEISCEARKGERLEPLTALAYR